MRTIQTTREQLLALSVAMFAENGFTQTSLRSIAKRAGVSPGLLVHHFGSKDDLVAEAISETLGRWVVGETAAVLDDESARVENWRMFIERNSTSLNFFRQVLLAGGTYAERLFDASLRESGTFLDQMKASGRLKELHDTEATALMISASGLGLILLLDHVERIMGGQIASETVATRLMNANTELWENGIFTPAPQGKRRADNR